MLGLSVVKQFLAGGHQISILSRRPEKCPAGTVPIPFERSDGLDHIAGRSYDLTLDFIAYDKDAPLEVFEKINPGIYILISSVWLVRLGVVKNLPNVTLDYISGKKRAEDVVLNRRISDKTSTVLRLPIFWGEREHTERLAFYCQRVSGNAPVILVNGGRNLAQIAWAEDIARAVFLWIDKDMVSEHVIWEALPDKGAKVSDIIRNIANARSADPKMIAVSSKVLSKELPEYLEKEPLWRESPFSLTKSNIFTNTGVSPTPQVDWLSKVARAESSIDTSGLRSKEIDFLKRFTGVS